MERITLGFHDVVTDRRNATPIAPGHTLVYTLDLATFREHLLAIRNAVGDRAVGGFDDPLAAVCLTFDDGAASAYTLVAPELESIGWRGHFFVTTDWIGMRGFLTAEQIRELHRRGHIIGSHSCSHPERISCLPRNQIGREWSESCLRLSEMLGDPVLSASVPGGHYRQRVGVAAAEAGVHALFTSEPTAAISAVNGCMLLGRYSVRGNMPASVSAELASGACWARRKQAGAWLVKKAAKAIMGPFYERARIVVMGQT